MKKKCCRKKSEGAILKSAKLILISSVLTVFILLPGRAVAARNSDIQNISKDVSSRIDLKVERTDPKTVNDPRELLEEPLTAEMAVQIALLNNKSLQAVM